MINLNTGNIWTNEYLDKVIELNNAHDDIKVKSLFGSIAELTPTARAADRLPYRSWDFIEEYVKRAQSNDIAIRYTLNQSCLGPLQDFIRDWLARLRHDIRQLQELGIHEWIITSPLIMELLRGEFRADFLEVSTIAEVSTPQDAARWKSLGANGVNISTSINRNAGAIREIVDTGIEVSILANEACLFRCPWRRECYNLSSHNSERAEALFGFYPFRRCNEIRLAHPEEWIRSRLVLPQWMKVYQQHTGVNWFKVAYRTHPYEVAIPMLEAYMNQQFDGNLCDLWPTISHLGSTPEPKDVTYISCTRLDEEKMVDWFLRYGNTCDIMTCGARCDYCARMYEKASQ